jgi:hypothetical protein
MDKFLLPKEKHYPKSQGIIKKYKQKNPNITTAPEIGVNGPSGVYKSIHIKSTLIKSQIKNC